MGREYLEAGRRIMEGMRFNRPDDFDRRTPILSDITFRRCFWPAFSEPTAIFAEGTSGLIVEGPPTPRNIIFPKDTVFRVAGKEVFFHENAQNAIVPERVLVTENLDVGRGKGIKEVSYFETQNVQKEVRVATELTPAEKDALPEFRL